MNLKVDNYKIPQENISFLKPGDSFQYLDEYYVVINKESSVNIPIIRDTDVAVLSLTYNRVGYFGKGVTVTPVDHEVQITPKVFS